MVKAWRELVTIPTYEAGTPEKNPMFLEKRVYQGSSGVVYPYPVIESVSDTKTDKDWMAVWLENEYLKVMILPELGGRIQMAYDKIKQRHFVYYNHVIKPALVGLAGPWVSGGIEFNWPQHHRPSTFLPVDCEIVENGDGSVTVWVNEMERMTHQKGMAGFTLRPGCAYLEIQGRVSNRTPLPQSFLWWANPAVEVNEHYQSVFPPDVNAVFDHGKRAVSSFPIATGTYYKMDYSAGVDISNYKNIHVPTSYMAVNSQYDFVGGYENDSKGGMLHVASHHVSPGKKQWTWGNGDFGKAWDRNLTDPTPLSSADGDKIPSPLNGKDAAVAGGFRPYIELMAGVYTENQPDFAWLMPYEEKQFVQYFMPYREIGIVKQATKDFIFNIDEVSEGKVEFKILATSQKTVRIVLENLHDKAYYDKKVTLSPENVFTETVKVKRNRLEDLHLRIELADLEYVAPYLEWSGEPDVIRAIPDAAEAPLSPQDTKTVDQLYLTGLHLEQYRHATWSALDYYEEALRRDPSDYRCNTQMGLWYLRRARFEKAESYLQTAVKALTKRNPNPYDGEALYYLGIVKRYLARNGEAYKYFRKCTWNKAWADAGYYEAACISIADQRWEDALDELEHALISNSHNHQARALKAMVLRLMNRLDESKAWIKESYKLDPFNYLCMVEEHIMTSDSEPLERMARLMHGNIYNYHEIALDYMHAGLNDEAKLVLQTAIDNGLDNSPLTYYYMAYASNILEATYYLQQARSASPDYCFPNRLEDAFILKHSGLNPFVKDARAPYYLGCLYYDKRQYDLAVKYWERSAKLDPDFPTVWRNLALARFNKSEKQPEPAVDAIMDKAVDMMSELANRLANGESVKSTQRDKAKSPQDEAVEYMERAFQLDETDARILMELDQLYKRLHRPHQERLDFLQKYPHLVQQRDDLILEKITLLNQLGRYEEAMQELDAHQFHPWEGGEGKVPEQYRICRIEMAKQLLSKQSRWHREAIAAGYERGRRLLEECLVYPAHLGEGKLYGTQDNDVLYYLGRYEEGTACPAEPAAAIYYNDAKPDKLFYAGLCHRRLGQEDKARSLFNKLVNYGKQHILEHQVMDYFAVSLPDMLIWDYSLDLQNKVHCNYMLALGYYGLGDQERAIRHLKEVELLDNNHQGAKQFRTFIDSGL